MSHSQFRRIKTYTETCMDESLRQAYDYWQDQPGSIRRCAKASSAHQLLIEKISIKVYCSALACFTAKIRYRMLDESKQAHLTGRSLAIQSRYYSFWLRGFKLFTTRNTSVAYIDYAKRTNTSFHVALAKLLPPASLNCIFIRELDWADRHRSSRLPISLTRIQANWSAFNSFDRRLLDFEFIECFTKHCEIWVVCSSFSSILN